MAGHEELLRLARGAGRAVPEDAGARRRLVEALEAAGDTSVIAWSPERLGAALGRVLADGEPLDGAVGRHLGDLHLAAAALEGVDDAVRAVEGLLGQAAAEALGGRGFGRDEIEEIAQELLIKLVVGGEEREARLASYSGKGRLGGFLRSAAVRTALNLRRGERRREARSLALELETVLEDPEVRHLKETYLESFRAALAAAWDGLSADRQLLLRHQFEDRLSIDDLARLQGVHRATAARRLAAARDELAAATRRQLQQSLGLASGDVESVMALIQSRLGDAADVLPGGSDGPR